MDSLFYSTPLNKNQVDQMNATKINFSRFILTLMISAASLLAQNQLIVPDKEAVILPSFTTLGFNLTYNGDANKNSRAVMSFRKSGESEWREGHPGIRIGHAGRFQPAVSGWQNEWAFRIFYLNPGTAYEIKIKFEDPDGVEGDPYPEFTVKTRGQYTLENHGREYHVSPTGNDGNRGTAQYPFRSIRRAINLVKAGETIILHDGIYRPFEGSGPVIIDKSGTAEAPIIIKAAPGAKAVITGSDPTLAQPGKAVWRDRGSGVYSTPLSQPPSEVFFEEHYLAHFESFAGLSSGQAKGYGRTGLFGGWWYDARARELCIKFPAAYDEWNGPSLDPTGHAIYASITLDGFKISGDHIVLEGLTIQHTRQAIALKSADYFVLRNSTLKGNIKGVFSRADLNEALSSYSLIEFNDISVSPTYWFREWGLGHDISAIGIGYATGGGHVIRYNTIHDIENGIYVGAVFRPGEKARATMGNPRYNPGTVVHDNHIYNIGDDAIEIDGPGYNLVVLRNRIHDVFVGVSTAPCAIGPAWILYNTFYFRNRYFNGRLSLTKKYPIPDTGFKFDTNMRAGVGPVIYYHNISLMELDPAAPFGSRTAFVTEWGTSPGMNVKSRNNIFVANPGRSVMYIAKDKIESAGRPVFLDMDYDNLWVDFSYRDSQLARVWGAGQEKMYKLTELQRYLNIELHGMNSRPKFANTAEGDFSLPVTSPMIDAGITIPGINDHYTGKAPDIGAVEYGGSISIPELPVMGQ
jgi:hypothetical protein